MALCSDVLCGLSNHPLHNMNMACDDQKRSPSQKRSILYCQSKISRSLPRRKRKKKPCWHFMSKSTNKHRSLHFRCSTNCTNAHVHLIPWDHTICPNLGAEPQAIYRLITGLGGFSFPSFSFPMSNAKQEEILAVGSTQGPGIRLTADNGIGRRTPKKRSGDCYVSDYFMGLPPRVFVEQERMNNWQLLNRPTLPQMHNRWSLCSLSKDLCSTRAIEVITVVLSLWYSWYHNLQYLSSKENRIYKSEKPGTRQAGHPIG